MLATLELKKYLKNDNPLTICLGVVFLSLTLTGTALSAPSPAPAKAALSPQLAKAVELYKKNQAEAALSILANLYKSNPAEQAYLHEYLSIASWSGQHELAVELAKKLNEDIAPFYVMEALADSRKKLKDFDGALNTYNKVLLRAPFRIEPRAGRLDIFIEQKRWDEGEKELNNIIGHTNNKLDSVANAIFRFNNTRALDLYNSGHGNESLAMFKNLTNKYPKETRYYIDYLAVASWSNHPDLAVSLSKKVKLAKAPVYMSEALALSYRQLKKYDEALSIYAAVIKAHPERLDSYVGRVNVFIDAERWQDGVQELKRSPANEKNAPALADAKFRLNNAWAMSLYNHKKPDEAIRTFENSLKESPQENRYYIDYIGVLSWTGHHELATSLSTKLDVNTAPMYALSAVAYSQRQLKQYDAALSLYAQLIKREPENAELYVSRINTYTDAANFSAGQPFVQQSKTKFKDNAAVEAAVVRFNRDYAGSYYRQNNAQASLAMFGKLHQEKPNEPAYLHDYLAIASWSGNSQLALDLSAQLDTATAPAYVLEALGQSYREVKKYNEALVIYDQLIARSPETISYKIDKINILIDAERLQEAEAYFNTIKQNNPNVAEIENVLLNIQKLAVQIDEKNSRPTKVLADAEAILRNHPDNAFAQLARYRALNTLGAFHLAGSLLPETALTADERLALKRNQSAFEFRWGRIDADAAEGGTERWSSVDSVIAKLKQLCAVTNSGVQKSAITEGACNDLVEALSYRGKKAEAIQLYEQMQDRQMPIPSYVQLAIADSYSQNNQHGQAISILQGLIQREPSNTGARFAYISALMDAEQYKQATLEADKLKNETPEYLNRGVPEFKSANPDYPRALLLPVIVRLEAGKYAEAKKMLDDLVSRAANNTDIRLELVRWYLKKGLRNKAESELQWLTVMNPNSQDVLSALFEVQLAAGAIPQAAETLKKMLIDFPDTTTTARSLHEWQRYNLADITMDARFGRGLSDSAGVSPFGTQESVFDSYLYSIPYYYNWRAFQHTQFASNTFPGSVNVSRGSSGVGLEYRAHSVMISGEVSKIGRLPDAITLESSLRLNDYWSVFSKIETNSLSAPVRAYYDGVTARNYQIGTSFSWDNAHSINLSSNGMKFSDGNLRQGIDANWVENWYATPRYQFSTIMDYYTSKNSSQSALINYFNPISDRYLGLTLKNEWVAGRLLEKEVKIGLNISGGTYQQTNVSPRQVFSAELAQAYQHSENLEVHYALGHTTHPYDGSMVVSNFLTLGINWRL